MREITWHDDSYNHAGKISSLAFIAPSDARLPNELVDEGIDDSGSYRFRKLN